MLKSFTKTNRIGLTGIPCGAGQQREGVELAPDALRSAGLVRGLSLAGWRVEDHGNLIANTSADAAKTISARATGSTSIEGASAEKPPFREMAVIAATGRMIADSVARVLASGATSIQIGGDHGLALGTISGAMRLFPDLRVIWVDAHGDSNTPETSPSGNFHGMPLAALMGLFAIRGLPGFEWLGPVLRPDRVALIGVRDLDPGEKRMIESLGIPHFSAKEVRARGAQAVISESLNRIDADSRSPLHYSLDIDAMDPAFAPATGLPVQEGLSLHEIEAIGRQIAATGRMISMDLAEINPLGVSPQEREITLNTGIRAVLSSLDGSASRAWVDEAS